MYKKFCNSHSPRLLPYSGTGSVADPDPFDPDPALHFDTDPDPAFQFHKSGSLPFQRGNVPKTSLLIYLFLIFLVSRSNRARPEGINC